MSTIHASTAFLEVLMFLEEIEGRHFKINHTIMSGKEDIFGVGISFLEKIRVCSVLHLKIPMWKGASDQNASKNEMGTLMLLLEHHRCFQN